MTGLIIRYQPKKQNQIPYYMHLQQLKNIILICLEIFKAILNRQEKQEASWQRNIQ